MEGVMDEALRRQGYEIADGKAKAPRVRFTPFSKLARKADERPGVFQVERDLSGGVRFTLEGRSFVVAPPVARSIMAAIGKALGDAS